MLRITSSLTSSCNLSGCVASHLLLLFSRYIVTECSCGGVSTSVSVTSDNRKMCVICLLRSLLRASVFADTFPNLILVMMTGTTILKLYLERYWASVIRDMAWKPFLGAAAGSPYIVFITRFRRMASGHGYIYIYIYIYRYIYNVDAAVV